jgi:hypothetical protein
MLLSASHGLLPPVSLFDADGVEIRHCMEIDTETGIGIQCPHFTDESLIAVPISIDFVDGDSNRVSCQWKAPIEVRSPSGVKIGSPLELLAFGRFHNLKVRIDGKGRAMSEKYKKAFEKLQRRLDYIDGSVKIALYEFRSFTVLPPDGCETL